MKKLIVLLGSCMLLVACHQSTTLEKETTTTTETQQSLTIKEIFDKNKEVMNRANSVSLDMDMIVTSSQNKAFRQNMSVSADIIKEPYAMKTETLVDNTSVMIYLKDQIMYAKVGDKWSKTNIETEFKQNIESIEKMYSNANLMSMFNDKWTDLTESKDMYTMTIDMSDDITLMASNSLLEDFNKMIPANEGVGMKIKSLEGQIKINKKSFHTKYIAIKMVVTISAEKMSQDACIEYEVAIHSIDKIKSIDVPEEALQ